MEKYQVAIFLTLHGEITIDTIHEIIPFFNYVYYAEDFKEILRIL